MIEWDEGSGILLVEGRPYQAAAVPGVPHRIPPTRRGPRTPADPPRFTLPVRPGLVAQITLHRDGAAGIELWAGEPEETDGIAVLSDSGFPYALARIPLCSCGDRGCGNLPLQLNADPVSGATLLSTLELVEGLRWDDRSATRSQETWQPETYRG